MIVTPGEDGKFHFVNPLLKFSYSTKPKQRLRFPYEIYQRTKNGLSLIWPDISFKYFPNSLYGERVYIPSLKTHLIMKGETLYKSENGFNGQIDTRFQVSPIDVTGAEGSNIFFYDEYFDTLYAGFGLWTKNQAKKGVVWQNVSNADSQTIACTESSTGLEIMYHYHLEASHKHVCLGYSLNNNNGTYTYNEGKVAISDDGGVTWTVTDVSPYFTTVSGNGWIKDNVMYFMVIPEGYTQSTAQQYGQYILSSTDGINWNKEPYIVRDENNNLTQFILSDSHQTCHVLINNKTQNTLLLYSRYKTCYIALSKDNGRTWKRFTNPIFNIPNEQGQIEASMTLSSIHFCEKFNVYIAFVYSYINKDRIKRIFYSYDGEKWYSKRVHLCMYDGLEVTNEDDKWQYHYSQTSDGVYASSDALIKINQI